MKLKMKGILGFVLLVILLVQSLGSAAPLRTNTLWAEGKIAEHPPESSSSSWQGSFEIDSIFPSSGTVHPAEYLPGEIILKIREVSALDITRSERGIVHVGIPSLDCLNDQYQVSAYQPLLEPGFLPREDVYGVSRIFIVSIPPETDIPSAVSAYACDPHIEYAHPNYRMTVFLEPNDPYYYSAGSWGQWYDDLYGMHLIDAAGAWDTTTGSHAVVTAVIDTGVDYTHPDLAENMWINEDEIPGNGIDDDDDGFIDNLYGADFIHNNGDPLDDHGHGTHCAGTIAAVGNNSCGVVGVNWRTSIMAIKGLDILGSGSSTGLAKAIIWAANQSADVLSNSWGSGGRLPSCPVLEDAVHHAYNLGCVVVFAAGNNNDDVQYYCPQNMNETITVAATDYYDWKTWYSNWGEKVDVCAPGEEILSLRAKNTDMYLGSFGYYAGERFVPPFDPDAKYYRARGTSMSCPHVAGLAALILSRNQSMPQELVRGFLAQTGEKVISDTYIGRRINASKALRPALAGFRWFPDNTDVKGVVTFTGSAWAEQFSYYVLSYGRGTNPASWIEIKNETTPVMNDILFSSWDTRLYDDGAYTFSLKVICSEGTVEERMTFVINNQYNELLVDDDGGTGVNYTKIQDAVDDAGRGDTVNVLNGWYPAALRIDRAIAVRGEDRLTTIISNAIEPSQAVVQIVADTVILSGFTIENTIGSALLIHADYTIVADNILRDSAIGIRLFYANYNTIDDNIFTNSNQGFSTEYAYINTIQRNMFSHCDVACHLWNFTMENEFSQNIFTDNTYGVLLNLTRLVGYSVVKHYNTFSKNRFLNNTYAIVFNSSNYNNITQNEIKNNKYGILLYISYTNTITRNNFQGNQRNIFFEFSDGKWKYNYWDRPRILPKILLGIEGFGLGRIPWIKVDWRPALSPNPIQ